MIQLLVVLQHQGSQRLAASTRVWRAGVYVGFGSFLAFTVGANLQEMAVSNPGLQKFLYGAVGLPAGLVMVSLLLPLYMPQYASKRKVDAIRPS